MDCIRTVVGENLKRIRKEKQLTLQEMSDITGISKSMLGEIERSVTNPTITVLWKIADGLKIPFTMLIKEEKDMISVMRKMDTKAVRQNNQFDIFSIFEFDQDKKFEVYNMVFPVNSDGEIKKHNKGVEEYLMVYEGVLNVYVNDEEIILNEGDSMRFFADVPHGYSNKGDVKTKAYSIIYYN